MDLQTLLANIIFTIHAAVIVWSIATPFITNETGMLVIHIAFVLGVMFHWMMNSNLCALSVIEAYMRNVHYTESFMHRLIGPIYDIHESEWITICYIVCAIVISVSIFKLWTKMDEVKSLFKI